MNMRTTVTRRRSDMCCLTCLLAWWFVLSAAAVHAADPVAEWSAESFLYDHDVPELKVVEDDDATGKKALELKVRSASLKEGNVPMLATPGTEELADGRYRATFRLRMQGMLHSLGTAIQLGVAKAEEGKAPGAPFAKCLLYPNQFTEEDAYQEFTLDFEVCGPALERYNFDEASQSRLRAPLRKGLKALSQEERQYIVDQLRKKPGTPITEPARISKEALRIIRQLNGRGVRPNQVCFTVGLLQNKPGIGGSRGNSTPFASLRRLTADTVKLEKLAEPAVTIRRFQAQYAWRRPGETQRFHLRLHNRSGAAHEAALRLTVKSGLDGATSVTAPAVNLANNQYQALHVDWPIPADHHQWGQEAVLEAVVDGTVVSSAHTWFAVHSRNTAVMIPTGEGWAKLQAHRWSHPTDGLPNVGNLEEFWCPTPYDSAGLIPDDPTKAFLRGNSAGLESFADQRKRAEANLDQGIASAFYLEQHGTGQRAWDLYFDSPDQVYHTKYAAPSDLFLLKRMEAKKKIEAWLASGRKGKLPEFPHVGFVMFNGYFKEAVDRIIKGHIELMNYVPYTGCRWDSSRPLEAFGRDILGHDLGKTQEEITAISVANVKRYIKEVRAAHPTFEFGININHGELMGKVPDPFDFDAARAVIDKDPIVKEVLADQGYILEEAWAHTFEVWTDYKYNARNYLRANRYEDAAYKYAGGHHGHMYLDNAVQYTPDDIYQQTFSLLGGAHLCYVNYGPLPESRYDLGVYACRFSEFFWDPALRPLTAIEEKVEVDTDSDIWFTEAGYEKDTPQGTRLYVLPVINPPVTETWLKNRYGLLPEPIREPLPMLVRIPEGFSRVKGVYHLENSPFPTVKPLEFEAQDAEVVFELPELVTFEVVVVEFAQ
ncbi:MAG: hypothetical protein ACYTGH_06650 [Planctomycetota bacterium]